MLKYAIALTLGLGLATQLPINAEVTTAPSTPTAPATAPVEKVGNTKCIVTIEEAMVKTPPTVIYQGKEYNLCCKSCIDDFKKDPEKYVKALEKDPAKYGVPAKK